MTGKVAVVECKAWWKWLALWEKANKGPFETQVLLSEREEKNRRRNLLQNLKRNSAIGARVRDFVELLARHTTHARGFFGGASLSLEQVPTKQAVPPMATTCMSTLGMIRSSSASPLKPTLDVAVSATVSPPSQ